MISIIISASGNGMVDINNSYAGMIKRTLQCFNISGDVYVISQQQYFFWGGEYVINRLQTAPEILFHVSHAKERHDCVFSFG